VVTELSRLGRSTGEVTNLINELVASDIQVVVIKQGLSLDKQQAVRGIGAGFDFSAHPGGPGRQEGSGHLSGQTQGDCDLCQAIQQRSYSC
jgi:hypothetical protein